MEFMIWKIVLLLKYSSCTEGLVYLLRRPLIYANVSYLLQVLLT
jgi:hypothetical protein